MTSQRGIGANITLVHMEEAWGNTSHKSCKHIFTASTFSSKTTFTLMNNIQGTMSYIIHNFSMGDLHVSSCVDVASYTYKQEFSKLYTQEFSKAMGRNFRKLFSYSILNKQYGIPRD